MDFDLGDIFNLDPDNAQLLQRIVQQVTPNPNSLALDVTADADEHQSAFIRTDARTVRLLAPAGSGKTQSIVNWVIRKLTEGARPDEFLIVTFDNAAAISLKARFHERLRSVHHGDKLLPTVQTLNGFGYRLLRGQLSDHYGPRSMGANPGKDVLETIRRILETLRREHPAAHRLLPPNLSRQVYADFIGRLKNNLVIADELFGPNAISRQHFLTLCERARLLEPWLMPLVLPAEEDYKLLVNTLLTIYREYCRVLANHNRVDFDDQKLLPYLALRDNPRLTDTVLHDVTAVVVDEFQDINVLDFEFIRILATNRRLLVVGDDDQAIYAFRGCSPEYIINFGQHILRDVEDHVLRINYRCPRNIVEMGNRLIRYNRFRVDKEQRADREDDADVTVWHSVNSASEAQIIARFIKRLYHELSGNGFSYADVALLFRLNSQTLPLQISFILEEIPYHCRREENVIVSETMEKLIGLIGLNLKLLRDPLYHSRPDSELLCRSFFRYVQDEQIQGFHRLAAHGGFRDAARRMARENPARFTGNFIAAVNMLYSDAPPRILVEQIGSNFKNLGGLIGSLDQAIDNTLPLGELVDIASRFRGTTEEFHDLLSRLLQKVNGGLYHSEEGDAVNLLTYFRAKGRQWHTVVLPGANQKIIPHSKRTSKTKGVCSTSL